ncbi:uncharacterized protein LOC108990314 [Juglans regia]|uniref:Uncharacterized protein LOC108990314 n=1 Tax=Juglans regia TaxID=51240 RepID=A0A6P9EQQ0_JUGRE|nr:uncharacterized protein LOC108990314 [Juglans regia]
MERTLVYPAIHPANDSIQTKDQPECKELIIDIPLALEASRWPDRCCIYRVPKRFHEVNNMAYTPRLVSIGPFHHRSEELKDMDIQKLIYLRDFCNRTGKSIEDLACIIEHKEMEIRRCYSENFLLSSEGFVNMILLDAIFILELFRRKSENSEAHDQKDYILSRPCMERSIQQDLFLLENQLPFFVLEELYRINELNVGHQNGEPKKKKQTLIELSCGFFGDLIYESGCKKKCGHVKQCFTDLVGCCCHLQDSNSSSPDPKQRFIADLVEYFNPDQQNRSSPEPKKEVKHFTDLVRYFFCPLKKEGQNSKPKCCTCTGCSRPPNQEQEDEKKRVKHLYGTATKLEEAGLKFTTPDSETYLLDIKFRRNVCLERFPIFNLSWFLSCLPCLKSTCLVDMQRFLEVPPLWIDDKTEGLFRNLMALEQCHYPSESYVCDYIVLLDDLITTKADVRLLVEKKIIVNELGSSAAVTKLVNNLALEIELERGKYHYRDLCDSLNDYSDNIWNGLVGTLTRVYFTDFFKGTATVVGIIVLVFTLWNFSRLLSKV